MSHQLFRIVFIMSLFSIISPKELLGSSKKYNIPIKQEENITAENDIIYVYTLAESDGAIGHTFKRHNKKPLGKENFKCGAVNNVEDSAITDLKEPDGFGSENDVYTVSMALKKGQYMLTQLTLTDYEPNEKIQVSAIMISTSLIIIIIIIIIVIALLVLILICWIVKKCLC